MDFKAAYKATTFLFLPTVVFLLLVFCWFFNWGDFISFITQKSGWAGFFRILVFVIEVIIWIYFYLEYRGQEQVKSFIEGGTTKSAFRTTLARYVVKDFYHKPHDTANVYETANPEVFIIKIKKDS